MAIRPVFYSYCSQDSEPSVKEVYVDFCWYPGFSIAQKQKSINSLHAAILNKTSLKHPLEISTKSQASLGIDLSAFNLQLRLRSDTPLIASVETIYQGSKIFDNKKRIDEDRYSLLPYDARQRARQLNEKHALTGWSIDRYFFGLQSGTEFYDWLYLGALFQQPSLLEQLDQYDCFTDIEFNPKKSLACQARSAALAKVAYGIKGGLLIVLKKITNAKCIQSDKNRFSNNLESGIESGFPLQLDLLVNT